MTDKQLAVLLKSYLARLNSVRDDIQKWLESIDAELERERTGFVLIDFDSLTRSIKNDIDNLNG